MLKGTTVTGNASKVIVKADTFIYNASAYRTPEGSVVEELVKRLPGAQVDDDGKITINGKEVKKIKVEPMTRRVTWLVSVVLTMARKKQSLTSVSRPV